ncbi:MAG TPA: serine/threonine-protein kinase [Polyangiaceae bacterium]|nr:serine/threonine-protein kinase [Polyangiaceae bacterium]
MDVDSVLAGKYRLISLIGRGGMGSVWKAEHLGLRALVAVKLIDQSIELLPEALSRFHREAQSAASLRSPHVVQILDHGVDDASQVPFIVMELMEGESLATRLERVHRLSAPETARIVSHVARALARAHEAGIVHRDLKPDNVFLVKNEDEEMAKVLDFGIAKSKAHAMSSDSATRTGSVLGTPYYMSPEQISGSKEIDYRTDLWALAVIAYEALTGKRPYDADTVGGLAIQICTQRPSPPSGHAPVPPGFDAWFDRATALEISRRYASARELADDLRRVCGTQSGRVSEVGNSGTQTVQREGMAPSLDALSSTTPSGAFDFRPRKKAWKLAAAAGAIIVLGLVAASWLTMPSTHSDAVNPTATAGESKALASPAPQAVPAVIPSPIPAEIPAATASAEVPRYEPPRVDLTKPAGRTYADDTARIARPAAKGTTKKNPAPSPAPATAPPNSESLPENGSLLDDRK